MGAVAVLGGIWEIAFHGVGVYLDSKVRRACQTGDQPMGGWRSEVKPLARAGLGAVADELDRPHEYLPSPHEMLPAEHASAMFVPWSDAEAIALYQGGGPFGWRIGDDPCMAIQRRQDAPALSRGNKPAPRCPLPCVAAGAVRPVSAWRLDRDRLAALTAAAAPGIPIIDAGTGPHQGVEGQDQVVAVTNTSPAD
jgi:hypothetical protein